MKPFITQVKALFSSFRNQRTKSPNREFLTVMREYLERYYIENELSDDTRGHYENRFRNIQLYFAAESLTLRHIGDISHKHLDGLFLFLKKELKTCSNRHATRHLELCRQVTKYALKQGYVPYDALTALEGKRDPKKKIVTLNKTEVAAWMGYKHQHARAQLIADLFSFQMVTGLSYMDIWRFKIEVEADVFFITNGRGKNDNFYSAELNHYAMDLLNKYMGAFPIVPNQVYNEKIKEIAFKIGIDKHLTTHVARKTFATLKFNAGYSMESVAAMLGHKNTDTTRNHYIQHDRERLLNERERLGAPDLLSA